MNNNLLYYDQTITASNPSSAQGKFIRDLKLDLVLDTIAEEDPYIRMLFRKLFLNPSVRKEEIIKRQEILKEAIHYQQFFNSVYLLSTEAINKINISSESSHPRYDNMIPVSKKLITQSDITVINLRYLGLINTLITDNKSSFSSSHLNEFITMTLKNYSKDFLQKSNELLNELQDLKFHSEIEIGGHPGFGLKLREVLLHTISPSEKNTTKTKPKYSNKADAVILLDNQTLINNSEEIINSCFVWILKTLSDFNNEVRTFFESVREMFGFYAGAVSLFHKITKEGEDVCFPDFISTKGYEFSSLKDIGLILKKEVPVVGNSVSFYRKNLCIITGANQGGKTTFLRSIGLAQLMAQCGLFVTAASFSCFIYNGIFTHFPDEEDRDLKTGLLEQELHRLHDLIPTMNKDSLLLMNETFSTTTEYDAGYLAEQITAAFRSCGLFTLFVTHLYEYAHKLYTEAPEDCIFFRAKRNNDGSRSFEIDTGEPVKSSYALDLYHEILD
ncbi:MutS-related protein [Anaerocolumna sp. MB42-C2]|uniref:MutS-related protein n=1 Tax=Anaerocolumna sp. MB42-C2 TaxID=3070997 RepID=UPI0027E1301F|nr:hypothetical protein [Anaerocolumna sp. MB42-C2]WMJ86000.1 hypothetical protein RBU59_18405 [Anaerocolumna sp. MB42-C2]